MNNSSFDELRMSGNSMRLSDFDYKYPPELVAQQPLPGRDTSRMLVVNRSDEGLSHNHVGDLPNFLNKGDVLVLNDTRVFPARLVGRKENGGKIEILLIKTVADRLWQCITNQTAKVKKGDKFFFGDDLMGMVIGREQDALVVEFNHPELIERVGLPPLPPYILSARAKMRVTSHESRVTALDRDRYQTIYALNTGSAAAPTAGLHFTEGLLQKIRDAGVKVVTVTLHVGLDTFSSVRVPDIRDHKMHGEDFFVPEETVVAVERAKKEGRRVIAVGTTTVRALESGWTPDRGGRVTNLFIRPGYKFRMVDAILTNFHQPKSTLLMMVSAFATKNLIFKAYNAAINDRYRLFSYGDCMLIV